MFFLTAQHSPYSLHTKLHMANLTSFRHLLANAMTQLTEHLIQYCSISGRLTADEPCSCMSWYVHTFICVCNAASEADLERKALNGTRPSHQSIARSTFPKHKNRLAALNVKGKTSQAQRCSIMYMLCYTRGVAYTHNVCIITSDDLRRLCASSSMRTLARSRAAPDTIRQHVCTNV